MPYIFESEHAIEFSIQCVLCKSFIAVERNSIQCVLGINFCLWIYWNVTHTIFPYREQRASEKFNTVNKRVKTKVMSEEDILLLLNHLNLKSDQ